MRTFTVIWPHGFGQFREVTPGIFAFISPAQGPWFYNSTGMVFRSGRWNCIREPRIEDISGKADPTCGTDSYHDEPAIPPQATVLRDQVIDVTAARWTSRGQLAWDVPEGKWTVVRYGHTSTGKNNHPAPQESMGLECDKMSKKAIEVQFDGLMGKLLADQAAAGRKSHDHDPHR